MTMEIEETTEHETRISWIRRHGWTPAVLDRAIASLTVAGAPACGVVEDAPLGAELIRWLQAAARGEGEGEVLEGIAYPLDHDTESVLPPVPPELEPVAAILCGENRIPRLRVACGDPVPTLIAMLDDLTSEERAADPELPAPHRAALAMLGELSTIEAVRYLARWMQHRREHNRDDRENGLAYEALRNARGEVVIEVATELWPSLDLSTRELVARVIGDSGARDDRFLELLLVELMEEWPCGGDAAEWALWAVEAYRDAKAAPVLERLHDRAEAAGDERQVDELRAVLDGFDRTSGEDCIARAT